MVEKKKQKILIAEDEELILEMYSVKFENSGFEVVKAVDGADALEKARSDNPDIVLLDIMMPKIDGFRVLQEMKNDSKLQSIPVLMLTNLGQEEDIKKGKEFGAADYVVKANSTPAQLVEKVEKFLK